MMTIVRPVVRMVIPWALVLVLVSSLGISHLSANGPAPLIGQPVYHPESKSYFELVKMGGYHRNWDDALVYASKRQYKGTNGHLAVVDSPELHEFLRTTFKPNRQTWIGMRYWCQFRKLQWVTGETLKRGDFKAWNSQWDLSGDTSGCSGTKGIYMPIFYTAYDQGFRWAAQGIGKNWHYYFIQYPTGEE